MLPKTSAHLRDKTAILSKYTIELSSLIYNIHAKTWPSNDQQLCWTYTLILDWSPAWSTSQQPRCRLRFYGPRRKKRRLSVSTRLFIVFDFLRYTGPVVRSATSAFRHTSHLLFSYVQDIDSCDEKQIEYYNTSLNYTYWILHHARTNIAEVYYNLYMHTQ